MYFKEWYMLANRVNTPASGRTKLPASSIHMHSIYIVKHAYASIH
jgi:hypothetical protein